MKGENGMIGDIFRQEREKKQLTLKDVESETNIRTLYLDAIEKGNYKTIRGEVYLKGFIRTYAKYLGLDQDEMLNKYYAERQPAEQPAAGVPNAAPDRTPQATTTETVSQKPAVSLDQRIKYRRKKRNFSNIVFGGIIIIIIIACAAYFIFSSFSTPTSPNPAPANPSSQTTAAPPTAPPVEKPSGVHINAVFNDKCWVDVTIDGKTVFSKTVDKGSSFNWDGQKDITMTLGNAGAAKVTFNGKSIDNLGAVGAVVTKKFADNKVEDIKK